VGRVGVGDAFFGILSYRQRCLTVFTAQVDIICISRNSDVSISRTRRGLTLTVPFADGTNCSDSIQRWFMVGTIHSLALNC
jgi:hypothetical protein